jgi:hypothetical protein
VRSHFALSRVAELTFAALTHSMNRRGWDKFLQRITSLDEAGQQREMEGICSAYKNKNKRRG